MKKFSSTKIYFTQNLPFSKSEFGMVWTDEAKDLNRVIRMKLVLSDSWTVLIHKERGVKSDFRQIAFGRFFLDETKVSLQRHRHSSARTVSLTTTQSSWASPPALFGINIWMFMLESRPQWITRYDRPCVRIAVLLPYSFIVLLQRTLSSHSPVENCCTRHS